jgi:hypothetical protein
VFQVGSVFCGAQSQDSSFFSWCSQRLGKTISGGSRVCAGAPRTCDRSSGAACGTRGELAGVGGRWVEVKRLRARSVEGRQLGLPGWREWSARDLQQLHVVALLMDGLQFGEHVVLAAVGVDEHGAKHVLGLLEGATDNAAAVRALLADLVERKLATDRALPIVIDGAKALRKAAVEVFGAHALIQPCR